MTGEFRIHVKICGITNAEDARQAALLGANAIGLNFHPESPRSVALADAEEIVRQVPPGVAVVGVFVRQTVQEACAVARRLGLAFIQRHGDQHEPCDVSPFRLIDAFRVSCRDDLRAVEQCVTEANRQGWPPDAVLIDARVAGQYGGTGKTAPWQLLAGWQPGARLILAGGLTADNVAEAVRIVRPWGVDVASGVEASPGKKDVEKMKRFIDNARSAG